MASFNVTSSLPGEFVTTNATDSDPVCVSRQKPAFLVFCLLPSVAILINVVVLVAVLRKTRKLVRQSHVYAHVSSTLIANVLLSVLGLVEVSASRVFTVACRKVSSPAFLSFDSNRLARWWLLETDIVLPNHIAHVISDHIKKQFCEAKAATGLQPSRTQVCVLTQLCVLTQKHVLRSPVVKVPKSSLCDTDRAHVCGLCHAAFERAANANCKVGEYVSEEQHLFEAGLISSHCAPKKCRTTKKICQMFDYSFAFPLPAIF